MNIFIGLFLIIYGSFVFNTGLKEEFNVKIDFRLFDQEGKLSPGIWRRQNIDDQIKTGLGIKLSENQLEDEDKFFGDKLGYKALSNLENEKKILNVSNNTFSFVYFSYFDFLPNLERIPVSNKRDTDSYFEILKKDNENIKIVAYVSNETFLKQNDELRGISIFSRKVLSEAENSILIDVKKIKVKSSRQIPISDTYSRIGVLEVDVSGFEKI
jgi:hypothetical protein